MNEQKIRVKHKQTLHQTILFAVCMSVLFLIACIATPLDFSYVSEGYKKIGGIVDQFVHPNLDSIPNYVSALVDTLSIALVGLLTALLFSLPLSFVVANNTTPSTLLSKILRVILSFIRSVPITIWGLIGAASIGFGSQAGVLGLFLPTMSYLIRVLSQRIEEGGNDVIEALHACGAPWIVVMYKGVCTQLLPQIITTITMRFELTVSETIALGMVGIAGIGYTLNMAIGTYQFSLAIVGILIIYITMVIIEFVTQYITRCIRKDGRS